MTPERKLKVFNIGAEWFVKFMEEQNIEVVRLDWSPPPRRPKDISSILKKLGR